MTDDPWLAIGTVCKHCGRELEARPRQARPLIVIDGEFPMEYRHRHDHKDACAVTHLVRPYSDWGDYRAWCSVRDGVGLDD